PAMRMNDAASSVLVAIGRPALAPLLELLKGKNKAANTIAEQYIAAIRERDPNAAAAMDAGAIVGYEATFTLGKLGYREAMDALLAETKVKHEGRRNAAAIALVSLNRSEADTAKVVEAIKRCFAAAEKISRPQLLVALQHMYSQRAMPFLLQNAKRDERELPDIRVLAYAGYAMLANKAETSSLKAIVNKEKRVGGFREAFQRYDAALDAARTCDTDLGCWAGKLGDKDKLVVRKAANMLARYGRGNDQAVTALVERLGHRNLEVRYAVLNALDFVAVRGSEAAIAKIDELRRREEGRSIWNNFKREALPTRHRLAARAQG
ncbi:MAG: hypothetical protein MJD61_22695, partial [Proteobacteria bacterium]|nr:hypothetical protein [Pseudomonadota bacterium]